MKKISYLLMLAFSFVLFNSCEDDSSDTSLDFVSFEGYEYDVVVVDVNGSATQEVTVYASKTTGSDRSISIMVDPSSTAAAGSYDVPSSVTIPGGANKGVFTVTMSDVDLGIGVNKLVLNFDNTADYSIGKSTSIEYIQRCTDVAATLDITFDSWGSECGWRVEDSLGGTVVSGGGYSNGQASATENFTLCAGRDYTFVFTDSYGDGMAGSYTLTVGGVEKVTGAGTNFGFDESTAFDTK